MAAVQEIESALYALAPRELTQSWDNVGLLVGDCGREAKRILVALDITPTVIREAAESGCDLIVSHHPVIFHPQAAIRSDDPTGRIVMELLRRDIAAVCMHTNLDTTTGGVNDALAAALGLEGVAPAGEVERIGSLPREMERAEFLALVKERLRPNGIRYSGGDRPIRRVAVGGGACGDFFAEANRLGCDTLVTADVKYNQFLEAAELGLCLIDAGHFPTEQVVCPVLVRYLTRRFPQLEILLSSSHREVIQYYM